MKKTKACSSISLFTCAAVAGLAAGWIAAEFRSGSARAGLTTKPLVSAGKGSSADPAHKAGSVLPAGHVQAGDRIIDLMSLLGGDVESKRTADELRAAVRAATAEEASRLLEDVVVSLFRLEPERCGELLRAVGDMGELSQRTAPEPILWDPFVEKLGYFHASERWRRVLRRAFAADAERSRLIVETLPDDSDHRELIGLACQAIAVRDPEAALERLPFRPPSDQFEPYDSVRKAVLEAAFSLLAARDPAGAARRWAEMPAEEDRGVALNCLVQAWAMQDASAFFAWLENLPPATATAALEKAFGIMSTAEVRRWLEQHRDPPDGRDLRMAALKAMAEDDPAEALRWLRELTRNETRSEREREQQSEIEQLERQWSRRLAGGRGSEESDVSDGAEEEGVDLEEQVRAVAENPALAAGITDSSTQQSLVGLLLSESPPKALEFSLMILDEAQRQSALLDVAAQVAVNAKGSDLTPEAVLARVQDPVARQRLERRLAARQAGLVGF